MSTLAEIEEAVASLSPDEREVLERRLHAMNRERARGGTIFTGSDAVRWWTEMEHLPATEAEALAEDVEAARREYVPASLRRRLQRASAMGVVFDSSIFITAGRGRFARAIVAQSHACPPTGMGAMISP